MKDYINDNTLAFGFLIAATLAVYLLAESATTLATTPIILVMIAKFLCIAYFFMELKRAHPVFIGTIAVYLAVVGGAFMYAF